MAYPYGEDSNHTTAYNHYVEGTGYLTNKEYTVAIDCYTKCIKIASNFNYKDLLAKSYEGIGIAYSELVKQYKNTNASSALVYATNAKKYLKKAVATYLFDEETINLIGEENVRASINNCKKIVESCESDIKFCNNKINGNCKQ